MLVTLTVVRYRPWMSFWGFLSMAVHRLPWWLGFRSGFYKLMGCGRNGTFSIVPDWRQFALLTVSTEPVEELLKQETPALLKTLYGSFISGWYQWLGCETYTFLLEPIEGHGLWDGKKVFGELKPKSAYEGPIAILTRATIRLHKAHRFWQYVDAVAAQMASAEGFVTSVGVGEIPWIKQATFSVWESKEKMKAFAYRMQEHAQVIRLTRSENWYSEDMFVRFKILAGRGTMQGIDPLAPLFASSGVMS